MNVIAMLNQKGGVGKTTSAINIGAGLTQLGKSVALIDLDPQASLTYSCGIPAHDLDDTVYELLKGECDMDQVVIENNDMLVIPANLELSGADMEFANTPGREFMLKEALEDLVDLDYVIIDCSPSLGILTLNALTSAQQVFIPLQTEFLPMQGMVKLLQTVEVVKKRLNPSLEISGIICTRYDARKKLHAEVVERIKEHFGDKAFETAIRDNISLAEAPSFGKSIFNYKPNSHGAEDYLNLCKEILKRGHIDG